MLSHLLRRHALPMTLVAGLLGTTGALAQPPWTGETFLSNYSQLKPEPSKTGQDFNYIASGAEAKLARITAVMVDEPEVSISPQSPYTGAKPDDLKAITELVRTSVGDRLTAWGYKVVDQPGPGVLYVRLGLTDLQLKKKKRKLLAYTPIGFVVNAAVKATQDMMEKIDILNLTMQAEVTDSVTDQELGAVVLLRGATADAATGAKSEPITFDQFNAMVGEYSDRLACRVAWSRLPAARRVDCTDPAARLAGIAAIKLAAK
jgi:hypothetical protein